MTENKNCPFCNSPANFEANYDNGTVLWECPTCGRFKLSAHSGENDFLKSNFKDMVATYLFYNGVHPKTNELFVRACLVSSENLSLIHISEPTRPST